MRDGVFTSPQHGRIASIFAGRNGSINMMGTMVKSRTACFKGNSEYLALECKGAGSCFFCYLTF